MDLFHELIIGFGVAIQPVNLFYCFLGCLIGTLVGVLPGLGPTAAMSLLLPATFHIPPVTAIIMLAGIYYGAMYGGSTTSILVNIPGEAASVMTCLDGYQMARQGQGRRGAGHVRLRLVHRRDPRDRRSDALGAAAGRFALKFGPPEYFSLMTMGMVVLSFLTGASMIHSLMMACFGLIVGTVGTDTVSGSTRFTFGLTELMDGVGLVPLVMGLFGISEILLNLEQKIDRDIFKTTVKGLLPTVEDWIQAKWAILRGTVIGFILGILPGGGAVLSSFVAYAVEKRVSKYPEKFGTGVIEGVAAPESRQQLRGPGGLHPAADPGPARQRRHGAAAGRPDPARRHAGPALAHQAPGYLLGGHRQHVPRQRHAAGPEPAAHRPVGAAVEDPLPVS